MGPRVVVAPDPFKGTFTAPEVTRAIVRGLEQAGAVADPCPVADGGEGTTDILVAAGGGRLAQREVRDPLGSPVTGRFGLLDPDGCCAVVDVASARGLDRLSPSELAPRTASSYGTGQLIGTAIEAGARRILMAAGGSGTADGGAGAIGAIQDGGARVTVLCDTRTAWERSAEVFGPQKGPGHPTCSIWPPAWTSRPARCRRSARGSDDRCRRGLAGALWAVFDAELVAGAPFLLDGLGFDDRLRSASCVVAGEGRLDLRNMTGKVIGEIGSRAQVARVPLEGDEALGRARQ